jgi:hypothetical protein
MISNRNAELNHIAGNRNAELIRLARTPALRPGQGLALDQQRIRMRVRRGLRPCVVACAYRPATMRRGVRLQACDHASWRAPTGLRPCVVACALAHTAADPQTNESRPRVLGVAGWNSVLG